MHSFIHSFERERERESAESLWSVVVASRRRTQTKTKKKRNAGNYLIFFRRRLRRRRRRGIKETKKRERNWSQRHKGTHFFHHLMGFER